MTWQVRISFPHGELLAELDDSFTAEAIAKALPVRGKASRWGEEVYFTIPVYVEEAPDARQDMEVGELGYWPTGTAFCIFFGPTPVSRGPKPRAYSNVNPFGRVLAGEKTLKEILAQVKDGDPVYVALSNGNT